MDWQPVQGLGGFHSTHWKEGGLESPIPTVLGIGGCKSEPADITDCWSSLPVSETLLVSEVTSCNKKTSCKYWLLTTQASIKCLKTKDFMFWLGKLLQCMW